MLMKLEFIIDVLNPQCPFIFFFTFIIFSGLDFMCAHTFILHNQRGSEN